MFDDVLNRLPERDRQRAEEIRVRKSRGVSVTLDDGEIRSVPGCALTIRDVLARATLNSLHSAQESLRHGYVTAPGGHRVGVCGSAAVKDGELTAWREIASVNIRLCKEVRSVAERAELKPTNFGEDRRPRSTLIISPPGAGKTTLLRDLIRVISERGFRVGAADERGELAAMRDGVPQLDVGSNTDVLEGLPRIDAVMLLLRSMSPQVIATDEVTAGSDFDALRQAANCGVKLLATSHRDDSDTSLFERVVRISVRGGRRVYDVTTLH
ncbi:MAG: stage III sporulation protein AB [Oscillospiraceae bacterium]|jgi:stage III sporulation protein AA|nr:stage III sporulation protein AB [Oscillospiraceae bacterium]